MDGIEEGRMTDRNDSPTFGMTLREIRCLVIAVLILVCGILALRSVVWWLFR